MQCLLAHAIWRCRIRSPPARTTIKRLRLRSAGRESHGRRLYLIKYNPMPLKLLLSLHALMPVTFLSYTLGVHSKPAVYTRRQSNPENTEICKQGLYHDLTGNAQTIPPGSQKITRDTAPSCSMIEGALQAGNVIRGSHALEFIKHRGMVGIALTQKRDFGNHGCKVANPRGVN